MSVESIKAEIEALRLQLEAKKVELDEAKALEDGIEGDTDVTEKIRTFKNGAYTVIRVSQGTKRVDITILTPKVRAFIAALERGLTEVE